MAIAQILREQRETILDDWEREVRRSQSESAGLSREELRDDIPHFLDRLIDWLESASTDTSDAVAQETTGKHALQRLQHGTELRHLIHEYRLLRQVILRRVVPGEEPPPELKGDLPRLADAIDHAMTESVAAYAFARDEAREMMLAVLSHDLRNPVNAIGLAATALLKTGRLNQVEAGVVSRIARSADRTTRMISDLLDLARSRFGGRIPISRAWMDLGDVGQFVVEELRLAHPHRDVRFACQGDVRGNWDCDRMAQLVSNLVGNAIRHGTDPISVDILDEGETVAVTVTNRGKRIPDEQMSSLFEPYRRGTHAYAGGLGLGLFIVAEIVRVHGGKISVDSDAERTVFAARLPRRPPDE